MTPTDTFPGQVTLRRLGWASWGVALTLSGAGLVILVLTREVAIGPRWGPRGFVGLFVPTLSTVGALITARHPRHAVGWIFCATGLLSALQFFGEQYAVYTILVAPGRLPGGVALAWLQHWVWVLGVMPLITLMPLVFPDGRLVSPRWRPMAWWSVALTLVMATEYAVQPGRLGNFPAVTNPIGAPISMAAFERIFYAMYTLGSLTVFAAAVAVAQRLRRGQPTERQQLKWIAYAFGLVGIGTLMGGFVPGPGPWVMIGSLLCLHLAVGIALLRHRLWDVDLLIRRTLVYTVLTGLLAFIYFGTVLVSENLLRRLTGGDSPLGIVVSTLVIAALFVPLRGRVQRAIDRRFYRRKYDAARTLAAFGEQARHEPDLQRLSQRLLGVVQAAMEPTQVDLWLRPDTGPAQKAVKSAYNGRSLQQ